MKSEEDRFEPSHFYFLALDYLNAAASLIEARENQRIQLRFKHVVPYYLYTHCLELALKAFLRANGVSKKELASRKYGHDLVKLLDGCVSRGMVVNEHGKLVVHWLNDFVENQAFRYLRTGFHTLPAGQDMQLACQTILKTVGRVCDEVRDSE